MIMIPKAEVCRRPRAGDLGHVYGPGLPPCTNTVRFTVLPELFFLGERERRDDEMTACIKRTENPPSRQPHVDEVAAATF